METVNEETFVEWNEAMSIRHNPDFHHNQSNPLMRYLENKRTESILTYLDIKANDKILDLGCGAGNMLDRIEKGQRYGVDLSRFSLGLAKKRLNSRANLQRGNGESLPYKNNSFDKIFCSEVIEHTLCPEKIMDEIHRVLDPDGNCVVSIPNEKFSVNIKKALKRLGIFNVFLVPNEDGGGETKLTCEWHLHLFSLDVLQELIAKKFEITAKRAIPFGFLPIKYVVKLKKNIDLHH